ncbi:MAG: hypothetical protein KA015_03310 [Spirochaetes bacterium]|nr:hypothetical protein [Spirochaetota bacterium]
MDDKHFKRRIAVTGIVIFIISLIISSKLIYISFDKRISINKNNSRLIKRGYIKDSNGDYIAISVPGFSVYANPEEIESIDKTASTLSLLLSESKESISEKISRKKKFIWLKRNISKDEIGNIKNAKLKGIYIQEEDVRKYPYSNLFSHIIGFCSLENNGIEGLEYSYNDILNGKDKSASSYGLSEKYGSSLVLTIDRNIQDISYKALENAVITKNAKSGTIAVIEVKTGRILAIAKYPSFDPNNFSISTEDERRFFAITDSFEPGSVMKAFSASAWIENTKNINQRFTCTGAVKIGDTTINCTGSHGNLGVDDAIRFSCNSFIIQSIGSIESRKIHEIMNRFGFGEKTASGILGESSGILRPVNEWSGLSKYSISIGQEISVTVLQLASAYAAIANNGIYNSPYIIDRIEDNEGKTIRSFDKSDSKKVLPESNAIKMKNMLRDVIEKGTGRKAKLKYFTAGGKTGTAQKFIQKSYVKNVNFSVFSGFAPVEDSDICITIVIDEPKGITAASEIAAPVFSEIADSILLYRKVNVKKVPRDGIKKTSVISSAAHDIIPDFTGKTESEILDILSDIQKKYNVNYRLKGKGKAFVQYPPAGTSLDHGLNINIEFR